MMASQVPVAARAPVPAQPIEDKASAKVARRDETWRRRKRLRRAWARNQNWIAVAEPAAMATPPAATSAANGAKRASATTKGAKTAPIPPSTPQRLFDAQAKLMPTFNDYQKATTRQIPVIVLERM